jgi:hypothetical protein
MTLQNIQTFLNTKPGALKNYKEIINGVENSASQIIFDAAQTNKINPEFLLTLLQKEQSLIEDPTPSQAQLDWATGYSRCDGCNGVPAYKGFSKQVFNAASRFRQYLDSPEKFKVIANQPYITLDGIMITPNNQATASLYIYNPWQGGTETNGRYVGANYNFYKIWDKYFHTIFPDDTLLKERDSDKYWLIKYGARQTFVAPEVLASLYSTDIIQKSQVIPIRKISRYYTAGDPITLNQVYAGVPLDKTVDKEIWANVSEAEAIFKFKNLGIKAWTKDEITLHVLNVAGAKSNFYNETWPDPTGGISQEEEIVRPGEIATYRIILKPAQKIGAYEEIAQLKRVVKKNVTPEIVTAKNEPIIKNKNGIQLISKDFLPQEIKPGNLYNVQLEFNNTGTTTLTRNNLRLSAYDNNGKQSPLYHTTWRDKTKVAWMDQQTVKPGEIGSYKFTIQAPPKRNLYKHNFVLTKHEQNKQEIVTIDNQKKFSLTTQVGKPFQTNRVFEDIGAFNTFIARVKSPLASRLEKSTIPSLLTSNKRTIATLAIKNTGNFTWKRGELRLSAYDETPRAKNNISPFYHATWRDKTKVAWLNQQVVKPGETGTFTFSMKAPKTTKTYQHSFQLTSHAKDYNNQIIEIDGQKKIVYTTRVKGTKTTKAATQAY